MKASELFGVVVRATGFLTVLFGLWELWGGVENVVQNILSTDSGDQTSSFTFFADGIPALLAGVIIFFVADLIVHLAYRHPEP
jgi:hypothetical protein